MHSTILRLECSKLPVLTIFALLIKLKVVADIPETSLTTITYYDVKLQWNDAHRFCQSKGGNIFKENSRVRELALSGLIAFLESISPLSSNFWTGLHDIKHNETGQFYKWSDCSNMTDWNNFAIDEVFTENVFCVSLAPSDLSWHITDCSEKLHVICETSDPCSCSLELATDESPKSTSKASVIRNVSNLSECKVLCFEHVRGLEQCWGLTFNYSDNSCYLHEMLDLEPYAYGVDLVFFSKICYKAARRSAVIAPTTDPSLIPEAGCSENDILPTVEPCVYEISTNVISTSNSIPLTISTQTTDGIISTDTQLNDQTTRQQTNEQTTIQKTYNQTVPDNKCYCYPCQKVTDIPLEERLQQIISELSVDKKKTSVLRRKKYSADDPRISAKGIGLGGVFVLIFIVSGIVLLDVVRLKNDLFKGIKNIRRFLLTRKLAKY